MQLEDQFHDRRFGFIARHDQNGMASLLAKMAQCTAAKLTIGIDDTTRFGMRLMLPTIAQIADDEQVLALVANVEPVATMRCANRPGDLIIANSSLPGCDSSSGLVEISFDRDWSTIRHSWASAIHRSWRAFIL